MVYLFLGQEYFLKKQEIAKLKSKICGINSSDLNCDEFQADEDDLSKITECIRTIPFMSKTRLVIVNNVDKFTAEQKELISPAIENKPSSVVIILTADSLALQDSLYKLVTKHGKCINFDLLQADKLHRWVCDRFLSYNKKIHPDAVKILIDNIGNNLSRLNLAIELLVTFTGDKDIVSVSDIETVIGKSLEVTTYQLVEAVRYKDADLALKILQDLDRDPRSIAQITGLIGWHFRRIWRAKKLLFQRLPLAKVALAVGVPQYAKESFLKQVNKFSIKELERDFKILLKFDKDIKSASINPYRTLEFLVLQLCANS